MSKEIQELIHELDRWLYWHEKSYWKRQRQRKRQRWLDDVMRASFPQVIFVLITEPLSSWPWHIWCCFEMSVPRNIARYLPFNESRLQSMRLSTKITRCCYYVWSNKKSTQTSRSYATRPSLVVLTKDRYPGVTRKDFAQVCDSITYNLNIATILLCLDPAL